MSTHPLVQQFYARVWNAGEEDVESLLTEDFTFRGSLGTPAQGHAEFLDYVRSVRGSLAGYHCEIHRKMALGQPLIQEPPPAVWLRLAGSARRL